MTYTVHCRRCDHEMEVGNGWDFCGSVVECPACFTLNAVHSDEDADCNFWFCTDEPYGDEEMMEISK